jgi:hypothetical protein
MIYWTRYPSVFEAGATPYGESCPRLFAFRSLRTPMADQQDAVYVCILSPDDKGERCRYCGWATGGGHGKTRG